MGKRLIYIGFAEPTPDYLEESLKLDHEKDAIHVTVITDPRGYDPVAIAISNEDFRYKWNISKEGEIYEENKTRPNFVAHDIKNFLDELAKLNNGVVNYHRLWRQGVNTYEQLGSVGEIAKKTLEYKG